MSSHLSQKFQNVFTSENTEKLAFHQNIDYIIELQPGQKSSYEFIYFLSSAELKIFCEYLQNYLAKEFIQKSTSSAGTLIFFAFKKNRTLHLCVDYHGLNRVTIKNQYLLSLINEIMNQVNDANVFSKINLKNAYHQI